MRSTVLRNLCVSLLAVATPLAPSSTRQVTVDVTEIDTADAVSFVFFGDTRGEGRKDLVLLSGRQVVVHRCLPSGILTKEPTFSVKLPTGTVAVDLAPLDLERSTAVHAKAVLLCATPQGVFTRDLSSPDAVSLALALPPIDRPLIPRAAGASPIAMSIAEDLDLDGTPEILLPTAEGVAVFRWAGRGWAACGVVEAAPTVKLESGEDRPGSLIRQRFELPRVAAVDVQGPDGARKRLLAVTKGAECLVYNLTEGSLQIVQHARALYRLDEEDRFRELRGTRQNTEVNDRTVGLVPADFNGDGVPDFLSSRFRDGHVSIAFGQEGSFEVLVPDRVIDLDGWVILAQAKDVDGDGKPDLIVPRLPKLGIAGALKAILQRRIDLELWVFRNRGSGDPFAAAPDWKYTFDVEVRLGGESGKFSATARTVAGFHDVNGDGLQDFVTLRDDDKLSVRLGTHDGLFSRSESFSVPIPTTARASEIDLKACDVDGDGREDLLLLYGSNKRGTPNKVVFLHWPSANAPR